MRCIYGIALAALFLSGCGDSNAITLVKSGKLQKCTDKTVEQMVDGFLGSPKWESGIGTEGETKGLTLVDVQGKMTMLGKKVDTILQFIVNEEEGTFKVHALETNGVPQPNIMMIGLLSKMCE